MQGDLNDVNTDISNGRKPEKTGLLGRLGINPGALTGMNMGNMNQWTGKARDYARANPARTLGALSALVIGLGLMSRARR